MTEHLDSVRLKLEYSDSDTKERLMQSFEDSDNHQVADGGEQKIENENGEEETINEVSFVRWDGSDDWHGYLDWSEFSYSFGVDLAEEGIESFRSTIDDELFDRLSRTVYIYRRPLSVDEGNVHLFVDELVSRLENMGYDVEHERTGGSWISVNEETNETKTTEEYKWWFYIRNQDGSMPEHSLDLYFTEDGVSIAGHVTEGVEKEEEFRRILTEFSIED